jgi:hypothetical protein
LGDVRCGVPCIPEGVFIFMLVVGGELRQFAAAGLETFPFAILAVMAYASNPKGFGGKALTLTYWIILVGAVGITSLAMTAVGVLQLKVGGDPRAIPPPTTDQILRLLAAGLALTASAGIGLFCFSSWVRKRAATWIDLDPQSFIHATALATSITMIDVRDTVAGGAMPYQWLIPKAVETDGL